MPRKRRAAKKRTEPFELFDELVDILLLGWNAPRLRGGYAPDHDDFRMFEFSTDDLAHIWRTHRSALLDEWRRRGQTGPTFCEQQYEDATGMYHRPQRSEAVTP